MVIPGVVVAGVAEEQGSKLTLKAGVMCILLGIVAEEIWAGGMEKDMFTGAFEMIFREEDVFPLFAVGC